MMLVYNKFTTERVTTSLRQSALQLVYDDARLQQFYEAMLYTEFTTSLQQVYDRARYNEFTTERFTTSLR